MGENMKEVKKRIEVYDFVETMDNLLYIIDIISSCLLKMKSIDEDTIKNMESLRDDVDTSLSKILDLIPKKVIQTLP